MEDNNQFYVYVHLNSLTNEIFYVGKGKNYRSLSTVSRNKYWSDYISKLTIPYRILVIKEGLNENDALKLEYNIIQKISIHYSDNLTNIKGTDLEYENGIFMNISIGEETNIIEKDNNEPRFSNLGDNVIVNSLLNFPNDVILYPIKFQHEIFYDFFMDNLDKFEEEDDNVSSDIEDILDEIRNCFDEYIYNEKFSVDLFMKDFSLFKIDINELIDETESQLQEKFLNRMNVWIDETNQKLVNSLK